MYAQKRICSTRNSKKSIINIEEIAKIWYYEDFVVTFYNGEYPELYPEELVEHKKIHDKKIHDKKALDKIPPEISFQWGFCFSFAH